MNGADPGLSPVAKALLAARVWVAFVSVQVGVRRYALPELVERLGRRSRRPPAGTLPPARLGLIVARLSRVGGNPARCLLTSLVLYRLLRARGEPAQLVIGLPARPRSVDAHAWVEIDGVDVGPPPGRMNHQVLARYG
jgi:hypothetical protein